MAGVRTAGIVVDAPGPRPAYPRFRGIRPATDSQTRARKEPARGKDLPRKQARIEGVVVLKSPSCPAFRPARDARGPVLATALASGDGDASAQGTLDARYQVTLGGVSFGRGAWHVNVSDDQFTSAVSGTTTGVMRMFSTGRGTSASRGSVANGGVLNASSYSSSIATTQKYDEVRMQLNSGTVKDTWRSRRTVRTRSGFRFRTRTGAACSIR